MEFLFLGTGTSAGVPAIGCACAVCRSPDPRDRRLRTAAALRFTDPRGQPRVILIDAGPDLRQQALAHGLDRCDAIIFTHNHVDHTFGLDEVRRFNAVMQRPIDIYAEEHTLEHLRRVYAHIFDRDSNIQESFVATLVARRLRPERPLDLFGLRITPIRLLHGRLPVLGFRFDMIDSIDTMRMPRGGEDAAGNASEPGTRAGRAESDPEPINPSVPDEPSVLDESSGPGTGPPAPTAPDARRASFLPLAYCTDVSAIPPETWKLLAGVRTLVLDALRHRHHPTHFTLGQAIGVAHQVGAEQTWFVHMAHDLGHEATDAELPEGMHLAWDGLVLGGA